MKKKILISGDKGFIGSHLVGVIGDVGEVRGWDIKDKKDIFDPKFEKAMEWADVVIHLAAETSVNQSFEREKDFMKLNVLGTARVCELAVKYNTKIVFPSTAAYYYRNLSPYASSKALAEDICQAVAKFHPVTILRFFNVYGTNMNERTGSIMYSFAKGIADEGKVVVFGSGEQTRDFISVKDVASIVKEAVSSKWDGLIVDVGTGKEYTINYLAELFTHFGSGVTIYHDPPKREIKWSIADTQILKKVYKKKLVTNLEKDIKEIVEYYASS